MATKLTKPISRESVREFAHYQRTIIVTLAPGTDSRDDLIGLRLKGTRRQLVARLADVYRLAALWHAGKEQAAKRAARASGVPWRTAKKQFERGNRI